MKVKFLLDENLAPRFKSFLKREAPEMDVLRVGDEGAPPLGTLDPEILLYLETTRRFLVTDNRRSIPEHLRNHWDTGRHIWGIGCIRPSATLRSIVEELLLIWGASAPEEWLDHVRWIP